MKVLMFQPRFAALVRSGAKRTTIRPFRKIPIKVGDDLSLREWTDKPYRSKQITIRTAICRDIPIILIFRSGMVAIDGWAMTTSQSRHIARRDGFDSTQQMVNWFQETHGLPFSGVLIKW